jgi:dienelactone hydrolase
MTGVDVLSISGSADGLATPADIEASRTTLPGTTVFEVVDGANHAFFGDYGPQPGDGIPSITQDEARSIISRLSVAFVTDGART